MIYSRENNPDCQAPINLGFAPDGKERDYVTDDDLRKVMINPVFLTAVDAIKNVERLHIADIDRVLIEGYRPMHPPVGLSDIGEGILVRRVRRIIDQAKQNGDPLVTNEMRRKYSYLFDYEPKPPFPVKGDKDYVPREGEYSNTFNPDREPPIDFGIGPDAGDRHNFTEMQLQRVISNPIIRTGIDMVSKGIRFIEWREVLKQGYDPPVIPQGLSDIGLSRLYAEAMRRIRKSLYTDMPLVTDEMRLKYRYLYNLPETIVVNEWGYNEHDLDIEE